MHRFGVSGAIAFFPKQDYFGKQRVALRVGANTPLYLHTDHLGSTSATTNSTGTSTSSQLYYAFGNVRATTGTVPTDFGFTGQRRDASAGLMYYGARYYDSALGRFITADTMVATAGTPQGLNRYAYALNNPIKYVDPSGHCINNAGEMTRDTYFDCTIDELAGLNWDTRKTWLGYLADKAKTPDWFNNINGIIDFFAQNPLFSDLNGWASWADAGVLQGIQDGFRQSRDDFRIGTCEVCANRWEAFFRDFPTSGDDARIMSWASAEQAGIDYGIAIGDAKDPDARVETTILWPGSLAEPFIHNFVQGGNFYRYLGSIPNGGARFGASIGGAVGNSTCGPLCASGGNIVGGYFGDWFVDPRNQVPIVGNSPVYWSAWLITAYTPAGPRLPILPKPQ